MNPRFLIILTTVLLLLAVQNSGRAETRTKLIFDTDTAVFNDDAAALVMILRYPEKFDLLGVTVVAGNHHAKQGAEYMLHVMELMDATDIPLYIGAQSPLVNTVERARRQEEQWGKLGFQGAFEASEDIKPPFGGQFAKTRPRKENAISFLIESIENNPGEVTILAIGPMTNIAMLLNLRPDLGPKIKSLVFMGGNARVPGNVTPFAEFNFWFDPEAAQAVLKSDIPEKIMFGLDITNHATLTKKHFDEIVAAKTELTEIFDYDLGEGWPWFHKNPKATVYIWDCLAAGYLIDPSFVTASEIANVEVSTVFGPSYGGTYVPFEGSEGVGGEVQVMLDLDFPRFWEMYKDLITRPLPESN